MFMPQATTLIFSFILHLSVLFLLQHKVTQMFRNVSSEERGEQTKYIGE